MSWEKYIDEAYEKYEQNIYRCDVVMLQTTPIKQLFEYAAEFGRNFERERSKILLDALKSRAEPIKDNKKDDIRYLLLVIEADCKAAASAIAAYEREAGKGE